MRCRVRRKCGVGIDGCQDWVGEVLLNSAATVDPLWELACQRWQSFCVHIHSCGNGHLWFRFYSESLLANAPKGTKRSCPNIRPPRLGSAYLRSGIHPWVIASGWLRWHLLSMTAAAPQRATRSPRMNASTQPSVTGPVDQDQKQPRRPTGRPDWRAMRWMQILRSTILCGSQPASDGR